MAQSVNPRNEGCIATENDDECGCVVCKARLHCEEIQSAMRKTVFCDCEKTIFPSKFNDEKLLYLRVKQEKHIILQNNKFPN